MTGKKTRRHRLGDPRDPRLWMRIANRVHERQPVNDVSESGEKYYAEMRFALC